MGGRRVGIAPNAPLSPNLPGAFPNEPDLSGARTPETSHGQSTAHRGIVAGWVCPSFKACITRFGGAITTFERDEQRAKVQESQAKGHGKRLDQRQHALGRVEQELQDAQHHQAHLEAQVEALGPPKERADRDFRKQTIMTCRTLLRVNALMAFMATLLAQMQSEVSLECVLSILFKRSGARLETASEIVYWVNTAGLSRPYRRLLEEIVDGLCAMDLRHQGKPIRVALKDMPL